MIGRIDEVVVDCANPSVSAQFWSAVLGGVPCARDESWQYVDPPGWTRLAFQTVPEGKTVKNRLHLDVGVSDIAEAHRAGRGPWCPKGRRHPRRQCRVLPGPIRS